MRSRSALRRSPGYRRKARPSTSACASATRLGQRRPQRHAVGTARRPHPGPRRQPGEPHPADPASVNLLHPRQSQASSVWTDRTTVPTRRVEHPVCPRPCCPRHRRPPARSVPASRHGAPARPRCCTLTAPACCRAATSLGIWSCAGGGREEEGGSRLRSTIPARLPGGTSWPSQCDTDVHPERAERDGCGGELVPPDESPSATRSGRSR